MSKGSQMPTVPEKLVSILVNSCAKVSSSVALFAGTFICFLFFVCFIYSEHLKGLGAFPITLVTAIGQLHRKCISYQWKLLNKLHFCTLTEEWFRWLSHKFQQCWKHREHWWAGTFTLTQKKKILSENLVEKWLMQATWQANNRTAG